MNFTVMVATHRKEVCAPLLEILDKLQAPHLIVDGTGYPCCARLWNECIEQCPTETVIICNEKSRPVRKNLEDLLHLLEFGYALVNLQQFRWFGFPKEVIRQIGAFDERYLGGWFEDSDFVLRLQEANYAYFGWSNVVQDQLPSAWNHDRATAHWRAKWKPGIPPGPKYIRQLPELPLEYALGPNQQRDFLPWSYTILGDFVGKYATEWEPVFVDATGNARHTPNWSPEFLESVRKEK